MGDTPSKDATSAGATSHASDRLLANEDRIIERWLERLRRELPVATQEPQPILIDTLPAVLRQIAEALSPLHPRRTATEGSSVAEEHGGERVRMTRFKLEDVVTEYQVLRQVLFEVLDEEAPVTVQERNTLNASMDQAIMKACTGYVLVEAGLKDQFFAILAHDLRNPLSTAKVNASLILRKPLDERVPRWAVRIIENIDRVDRMVWDLLDSMRAQAGVSFPLDLEACDLVEVAGQSIEHLETEHGPRFLLAAPEPVRGYFARDAVRRAIENLATNAVKYGSSSRPITITVRQTHERVILMVHNEGARIPPEEQETLFRAFRRLSGTETRGQSGWGLGLAQVRGVAESHGGSVAVESLPERGTTFTLDILQDARPVQQRKRPVSP